MLLKCYLYRQKKGTRYITATTTTIRDSGFSLDIGVEQIMPTAGSESYLFLIQLLVTKRYQYLKKSINKVCVK
jgi:hypothetical protein